MLVAPPDLASARRLLCVQPHCDDNDIGAGGTIAALAAAGAHVTYVTVTDDLVGVRDAALSDAAARAQLRAEQAEAGAAIGVAEHVWLDHPDAGAYDYFELRRQLVAQIRRVQPDLVFGVDSWMPYEAHSDHQRAGRALAEAVLLYRLPRFRADPQIDRDYRGHELRGAAFYMTARHNTWFDVSASRERKHRALDAYRSQFSAPELALLHGVLGLKERGWAQGKPFEYGEALMVLAPAHLHVNPDAEEMFSAAGAPGRGPSS
jgi:LmbE family N-acetylglucosaminyl deacetylase